MLSFTIFDREEVVTRYPFESGQEAEYVAIKSPQLVKLFLGYFEKLWVESNKLENEDDYVDLLAKIT